MLFENEWNESLFGCFNDWESCCCGFWCLPCLFGLNVEKSSNKNCVLMCCLYAVTSHCSICWIPHCLERKKLRVKHRLKSDPACGDCLTALCCRPCAICQEAREIKSRENIDYHLYGKGN